MGGAVALRTAAAAWRSVLRRAACRSPRPRQAGGASLPLAVPLNCDCLNQPTLPAPELPTDTPTPGCAFVDRATSTGRFHDANHPRFSGGSTGPSAVRSTAHQSGPRRTRKGADRAGVAGRQCPKGFFWGVRAVPGPLWALNSLEQTVLARSSRSRRGRPVHRRVRLMGPPARPMYWMLASRRRTRSRSSSTVFSAAVRILSTAQGY